MMKQLPNVGTAIFIRKDDKVLFGKRISSHGTGTWSIPGGYLEMYESWEDGARREAREETGIEVEHVKFIAATNDIFQEEGKHFITLFLAADWKAGEVENREPDKHEGWDWFEWTQLPQPLFLPVRNFIQSGYNPFNK